MAQWRSMRTASVLMPRSVSQASNGARHAAGRVLVELDRLELLPAPITAPPITSEWPPRYLVVEWTTRSAPSSSGCWRYGEANVLSTASMAPCWWASSAMAAMSRIWSRGLVGVSIQTSSVRGPMRAPKPAGLRSSV